jgi:hypothetical protein
MFGVRQLQEGPNATLPPRSSSRFHSVESIDGEATHDPGRTQGHDPERGSALDEQIGAHQADADPDDEHDRPQHAAALYPLLPRINHSDRKIAPLIWRGDRALATSRREDGAEPPDIDAIAPSCARRRASDQARPASYTSA